MNLTKDEATAIAHLIDSCLIDEIRNDTDIDNMNWLYNVLIGYKKLCEYGGYQGVTWDASKKEET